MGVRGVEREVGTSCNAFALPPCHSIKVIVFLNLFVFNKQQSRK